jgi:hypothetical protein
MEKDISSIQCHDFIIGPTDTDSISFCKSDMSEFTPEEIKSLVKEINDISPEFMIWDDDGYYMSCLALRAKNYILFDGEEKKIKGSAFKSSTKEPALKLFMQELVDSLLLRDGNDLLDIYHRYILEAMSPQDIKRWCQKKTVSESVLNCSGYDSLSEDDEDSPRKNESDVWDAIKNEEGIQQGDKIYVYPVNLGPREFQEKIMKKNKETGLRECVGMRTKTKDVYGLRLSKYYKNDIATDKLLKRVYDTMKIFETVVDISKFPKYHQKTQANVLKQLIEKGTT